MIFDRIINFKSYLFDNKTVKQTIFKNSFWLAASGVLDSFLKFILSIYIARILGAAEYGKFSFALAFISLFVVFNDLGLSTIVTREFAGEKKNSEDFSSIISLKILLSLLAFVLILIGSFFITKDPATQSLIVILAIFSLINGFIAIFYALFSARQRIEYQAWSETFQGILIVGIGLFVLFSFPSVGNLGYAYLFASFVTLISVLIFSHFKLFSLKISWQKSVWRKFLKMSWPLALMILFGTIYSYIDSVILGYWGMIEETGWYNAAYRVIVISFFPLALITGSFFPAFASLFKQSKEKLQQFLDYEIEIVISLATPLVVGTIILAPKIINFLYPASFSPSVLALQILILMVGFVYISRPVYDAMIASHQQKKIFWITLLGVLLNIILNFILIPKYTLYGAAAATVISSFFTLIVCFIFAKKSSLLGFRYSRLFFIFLMTIIASIPMYFVIIQPPIYNLNIFVLAAIAGFTYFAALFSVKKIIKIN